MAPGKGLGKGRSGPRRGEHGRVAAKRRRSRAPARGVAAARASTATRPSARRLRLLRALPSWRVLVAAWAVVAAIGGAYAVARETSLFAIRRVEVVGAPPAVADAVRNAVGDFRGASLVSIDGAALVGRVDAVPAVAAARYDRAFPHTLRILVRTERPVAVLRAGRGSWLVSSSGRVIALVPRRADAALPRIWVPAATPVAVGASLPDDAGGAAARALAPLAHGGFPVRVTSAQLARGELKLELADGVELRLGRPDDLRLKLAVARLIVRALAPGSTYADVSVPERPVSGGGNSQVSG